MVLAVPFDPGDRISSAPYASPEELGSMLAEFDKLVRSHFDAEEKRIVPWALQIELQPETLAKKEPKSTSEKRSQSSLAI
jgi:hypothetical protein